MTEVEKKINERIKEIMCEKGYNQSELADITGIAQSTISAILRGARKHTPLTDALSEKFGINKEWLLSGVGFKYSNSTNITERLHLDITTRTAIMREVNALYTKHQSLLEEAGKVMATIVELNKKILLNDDYVM